MVLRVDVVAAALEAVYDGMPTHRVVALSPQGRLLDQPLVEELAGEPRLTILSARFEGFDERIVDHLATDAISIGRYVLSGGELPAMVIVDAIARRLPGALTAGSGEDELLAGARGTPRVPALHAPARLRGWRVPDVLLSGDHARIADWRREQSRARSGADAMRNPVDRLTQGLPHPWRVTVDWVVTIVGAIAIVLAVKAWVVNPYRIPSSSMEPTLHCAKPGSGCEADFSDRVLANRLVYRWRKPERGDVVVFETPRSRFSAAAPAGRS